MLTAAGCPVPQAGHCTVFQHTGFIHGCWQIAVSADSKGKASFSAPYSLVRHVFDFFRAPATVQCHVATQVHLQMDETAESYPASIPRCRGSFGLAGYYHQFALNFADLTKRVAQIWSSGRSSARQRAGEEGPLWGSPASADGHLEQSLGAVLSQQVGWTTLSFTSAGACQSGCSTVELEGLAVTPPLLPPRLCFPVFLTQWGDFR